LGITIIQSASLPLQLTPQFPCQAAAEAVPSSNSNWQWGWIGGSPSTVQQPDPLKQAKADIAMLQV
jgi:hypothetical protein